FDNHSGNLLNQFFWELCCADNLDGLRLVDSSQGVDLNACECFWFFYRKLLNLHATLIAGEREIGAFCPVEQYREIKFFSDPGAGGDHDSLDNMTLNIESKDCL